MSRRPWNLRNRSWQREFNRRRRRSMLGTIPRVPIREGLHGQRCWSAILLLSHRLSPPHNRSSTRGSCGSGSGANTWAARVSTARCGASASTDAALGARLIERAPLAPRAPASSRERAFRSYWRAAFRPELERGGRTFELHALPGVGERPSHLADQGRPPGSAGEAVRVARRRSCAAGLRQPPPMLNRT